MRVHIVDTPISCPHQTGGPRAAADASAPNYLEAPPRHLSQRKKKTRFLRINPSLTRVVPRLSVESTVHGHLSRTADGHRTASEARSVTMVAGEESGVGDLMINAKGKNNYYVTNSLAEVLRI